MSIQNSYEQELSARVAEERAAVELIKLISDMWFDKSVKLIMFRKPLMNRRTSEVLNLIEYAKDFVEQPINIADTLTVTKKLSALDLAPAKIDLGRLVYQWVKFQGNHENMDEFLNIQMQNYLKSETSNLEPKDVVLYGLGRIGRLLARELITQEGAGEQLRLRAIVIRNNDDNNLIKRTSLLRTDSVHGKFPGSVKADLENKAIVINGHSVKVIAASNPEDIDYTAYGINNALVLDNTGVFTDKESLSRHMKAKGVAKVLLTAPGKEIPNIVFGANHKEYSPETTDIFSAASCTTNAITPILKVANDSLGIEKGHIETVHAYTNDQNLVDNMHKKNRRGRAAALNMVITSTGAGKAVVKVIPSLDGKLTANAVRVPTPNGSLAILNLTVSKATTVNELNGLMKDAALRGELVEQINYSISDELVSSDIVGNPAAAIYDSPATIVSKDGKNIVMYVWYDNEYGYSRQVMRLAKHVSNVRRNTYY